MHQKEQLNWKQLRGRKTLNILWSSQLIIWADCVTKYSNTVSLNYIWVECSSLLSVQKFCCGRTFVRPSWTCSNFRKVGQLNRQWNRYVFTMWCTFCYTNVVLVVSWVRCFFCWWRLTTISARDKCHTSWCSEEMLWISYRIDSFVLPLWRYDLLIWPPWTASTIDFYWQMSATGC